MITLQDPEKIELSNKAFRSWMHSAGLKIKELDQKHCDILTEYYLSLNDNERELQLFDLRFEVIGLRLALKAVMALWAQLKSEMD